MRGYVVVDRTELKVKEYEMYTAYYCGVCRSIGRRYGQLPRLALSYDAAFLAVLLASLDNESENIISERCVVHPIKKKNFVINSKAIDFAADIMLIMSYGKLEDDVKDDNSIIAAVLAKCYKSAYQRLKGKYPEVTVIMEKELSALLKLEKCKSASLDETGECFGIMLGTALAAYFSPDEANKKIFYNVGYNLGMWIYLADAADDLEKDIEKKRYNPLIYRFDFKPEDENVVEFKERIKETLEYNLYNYLGETAKAIDLIDIKKNKGIVDNVVFLGLRNKTEEVLSQKQKIEDRKVFK